MTRLVTLAGYAVIVACAVGLELAARRRGGATFGDALTWLVRQWPVRLLLVLGWLWLGWHVFVRVDWG
ncbi:MAG: DUF6186 family protein [Acidimicrobiales bacterium]